MLGPPSDADAVEGHDNQPRNPTLESLNAHSAGVSAQRPSFDQIKSEKEQQIAEALDRLSRLGLHRRPSFPPPNLSLSSSDGEHPRSSFNPISMSASGQPVFDDHEDNDYDDLSSSRSSEAYSPRFEPSLPSLVSRVATPDNTEPDLLSLSGDTVSNADTVSDQLDGPDSAESFDYIRHEDIPDELRNTPLDTEEMDQGIMMSDHTIVPPTSTMSQRLSAIEPLTSSTSVIEPRSSSRPVTYLDDKAFETFAFSKTDKPYSMPKRALRLLFVAATDMDEEKQWEIMAKLVMAITGENIDELTTEDTDEHVMQPFHRKFVFRLNGLPEDKCITICITDAVACSVEKNTVTLKGGSTLDLSGSLLPDFAIFVHATLQFPPVSDLDVPHVTIVHTFAKALSQRNVAMLELCEDHEHVPSVLVGMGPGKDGLPYMHIRKVSRSGDKGTQVSPKPLAVPLSTFHQLDDDVLNRHLAWISGQQESKSAHGKFSKKTFRKRYNTMTTPNVLSIFFVIVAALICGLRVTMVGRAMPDITSNLALRQEALSVALNTSGLSSVNASNILHYPTTTGISSGTTTIGLALPTLASVHVAKPEQLFIAIPQTYRSSAYLGVFRNGKSIDDFNITKLIDGVYAMKLKSSEAYGHIEVHVRSTANPFMNETVKVDLGSRLLQRATYESVARDVQLNIQRDVEEVHTAARAVQARLVNNTQSVLKLSVHRAKALRNGFFGAASNTAQHISRGIHDVANSTHGALKSSGNLLALAHSKNVQLIRTGASLTKNATLAVGSVLAKPIPGKQDFARARSNSLKLKAKLSRKPVLKEQQATGSVFAQFKQFGRDAGQRTQTFYNDVLAAGVDKIFSKPQRAVQASRPLKGEVAKALSKVEVSKKCSMTGLTCQKKCKKDMKGDITCNKCKQQRKSLPPYTNVRVQTKQVEDNTKARDK